MGCSKKFFLSILFIIFSAQLMLVSMEQPIFDNSLPKASVDEHDYEYFSSRLEVVLITSSLYNIKYETSKLALNCLINAHRENPLHIIAQRCDYIATEVASWLIARGVDVNHKNRAGETPLHRAVEYKNYGVARILLEAGALFNNKDNAGQTPLDWAARMGDEDMLALIMEISIQHLNAEIEPYQDKKETSKKKKKNVLSKLKLKRQANIDEISTSKKALILEINRFLKLLCSLLS